MPQFVPGHSKQMDANVGWSIPTSGPFFNEPKAGDIMVKRLNSEFESTRAVQSLAQGGLLTEKISRRDFGKLLGAHTVLFSTLPLAGLAGCGGGSSGDSPEPVVYPVATPIADTTAQPATIGSYQKKNGYFTWSVTPPSSASREIEIYIPKGARQREFWIGITLPAGVQSNKFLSDAGWFALADEGLACLLIMKPGSSGIWGDVKTELAYVTAAMGTLVSNGTHYSAMTYHYVVGYGAGAAALQLYAANTPLSMISQVYLEAAADAAYDALLTTAGNTQFGPTVQPNNMNFTGYLDINGDPLTQQRAFAALYYRDIPIPTWFVGDTAPSLLAYWAGVNDCGILPVTDANYGQIFWQDKEISNAIATAASDVKAQVAMKSGSSKLDDPALTKSIYSFLTQYAGYDNNSCYGHWFTNRLDYKKAISSGNMVYKDHTWSGSTTLQTYIVYVPDSVKKNYSLSKPAPVLFCSHGAGQTAFVFMEATDIKEAANKYGFIAVTYDSTTVAYMTDLVALVKQDCLTLGVAADATRLYVYGQSAGGGAVTSFARDATLVNTFAAFGHTSGTWSEPAAGSSTALVPVYAIYGEYDYWPMKLGPLVAGEWRGSQNTQYAWTTSIQDYWLNRLIGRTLVQEMAAPTYALMDGISASLVPQNTPISLILKPTATANRYKIYTWKRNDVPLFVWGQCFGKGHNNIPGNINKLWEEWFSKWQRSAQANTLLYWKDGVGVGQSTVFAQS
jgi:poly(3-hydroxybutyrate) depolymerase